MRNMVQLRNKLHLQQVGIPQGSVLSALLGSYYYGHMERNVIFPFLEKAKRSLSVTQHSSDGTSVSGGNRQTEIAAPGCESLLLRYLDDFLFISASKRQASMFFTRLERGVRDYNCCMNKQKYGLNFTMENQQGQLSNRLHTGKDNISFLQWSGLLVNCSTLEIQADYTRFAYFFSHELAYFVVCFLTLFPHLLFIAVYISDSCMLYRYLNHHMRSTLTVSRQGKVGKNLNQS